LRRGVLRQFQAWNHLRTLGVKLSFCKPIPIDKFWWDSSVLRTKIKFHVSWEYWVRKWTNFEVEIPYSNKESSWPHNTSLACSKLLSDCRRETWTKGMWQVSDVRYACPWVPLSHDRHLWKAPITTFFF
jgi:hypothetical protein